MQWSIIWAILSTWIFHTSARSVPFPEPNFNKPPPYPRTLHKTSPLHITGRHAARQKTQNLLRNPSFESGLHPWQPYVTGAWSSYEVTTQSAKNGGQASYEAVSDSTTPVTLTLFQSVNIPSGTLIECSTWVRSARKSGTTAFEVFLDGTSCGRVDLVDSNWVNVGQRVKVEGDIHTFTVVVIAQNAGNSGWMSVFIDEAKVVPV